MKITHAITNAITALSDTRIKVGEIQWDGIDSREWRGYLYVAGTTNGTVAFYGETNADDIMLAECDEDGGWVCHEDSDGAAYLLTQLENITWDEAAPESLTEFAKELKSFAN